MFLCDVMGCDFKATKLSYVNAHKRIHVGLLVYSCHMCDCHTSTPRSLKNHIAIHENNRSLACSLCEYRANYESLMKVHMKRAHNR